MYTMIPLKDLVEGGLIMLEMVIAILDPAAKPEDPTFVVIVIVS